MGAPMDEIHVGDKFIFKRDLMGFAGAFLGQKVEVLDTDWPNSNRLRVKTERGTPLVVRPDELEEIHKH